MRCFFVIKWTRGRIERGTAQHRPGATPPPGRRPGDSPPCPPGRRGGKKGRAVRSKPPQTRKTRAALHGPPGGGKEATKGRAGGGRIVAERARPRISTRPPEWAARAASAKQGGKGRCGARPPRRTCGRGGMGGGLCPLTWVYRFGFEGNQKGRGVPLPCKGSSALLDRRAVPVRL